MRILFLLTYFAYSCFAYSAEPWACDSGIITHKLKGTTNTKTFEICRNKYGQFVSKNCTDGCVFLDELKKIDSNNNTSAVGTPGGRLCKRMGYTSIISTIQFQQKKLENIDLCYNKEKTTFVSSAFLSDLASDLAKAQK